MSQMILGISAIVLLATVTAYAVVALRRYGGSSFLFPNKAGKTARVAVGISTVIVLGAAVIAVAVLNQETKRRPSRYLIPESYIGWVRVEFKIEGAQPLPIEDGFYLFRIPNQGVLRTSSDIEYGAAKDEYYYYSMTGRRALPVTGWGGGGMIWANSTGTHTDIRGNVTTIERFFVGTEEQYRSLENE